MTRTVLLVLLLLMLVGTVPVWPYSAHWGYYPVSGVGFLVFLLVLFAFLGDSRRSDIL